MSTTQAQSSDTSKNGTVDAEDVARFSAIAAEWWDPLGKFKPLHAINPVRIAYVRDQILSHFGRPHTVESPLSGLSLLDIGCGGGLVAEPMARLGAQVTGIDASEKNITVASLHAQSGGLNVDYRASTAEALAESGAQYDVVLALEIVEHVADVSLFLRSLATLIKPQGMLVMSTLNRTAKSYLMAIIGAEYVLRLLPRGTHQWQQFIRPSELASGVEKSGLHVQEIKGLVLNPLRNSWHIHPRDLDVNYLLVARKGE
jgi:2-polyprenyl-6-hydroxyphenyl methylase/3-demethylubiquinone-9 3-methyltransferase